MNISHVVHHKQIWNVCCTGIRSGKQMGHRSRERTVFLKQ